MHGRICQSRLGSYPYARSMIGRVIYGLDVLRKSLSLSLSLSLSVFKHAAKTHVWRLLVPWTNKYTQMISSHPEQREPQDHRSTV